MWVLRLRIYKRRRACLLIYLVLPNWENEQIIRQFCQRWCDQNTLWLVSNPETAILFSRWANIDLHHIAFKQENLEALEALNSKLRVWSGVVVEFTPEFLGQGLSHHMMILEPGYSNRVYRKERVAYSCGFMGPLNV